jgi:hypothetical protein
MGALRLQGIKTFPYLDDILVIAESRHLLMDHLYVTLNLLTQAGFIVNLAKSQLQPSQDLVFLGARIQTDKDRISLPQVKADRIAQMVATFVPGRAFTARRWLQLLGVMAATIPMMRLARQRMRPIQWYLHSQWNRSRQSLDHMVRVTDQVHQHLQWWTSMDNLLSSLPLSPVPERFVITTDASSLGWGGVLTESQVDGQWTVQGRWSFSQQEWHINLKELMAVYLTLQHFQDRIAQSQILVRSDNTTTCAYINKGGGTRSQNLCQLALQLWDWCVLHQVEVKAVHVPGVLNTLADSLSRKRIDQREWGLHSQVVHRIFSCWGRAQVDLFATCHNNKLPTYCSLYPFPGALAQDAFSISWSSFAVTYAFPPIVVLSKVLRKVRTDQARMILIAPRWPMRSWYPLLLDLLVDLPRILPWRQDLLTQFQIFHPDPSRLRLMAWKLSGIPSEQKAFQRKLLARSYNPERPAPSQATMPNGAFLFAGVVNGTWIPIRLL